MHEPKTLQEAIVYFADPDNCVSYLAGSRWPNGVVCPTCGRTGASYVAKRRIWQCKTRHAKCQFSVKVGTIFEDSPIGLDKWLMAMWMVSNCKNGVSSYEIHRDLGVTQKTAWFLLHRIRLAMRDENISKLGGDEGGPVEVDETFVGPKPQKMHRGRRLKMQTAQSGQAKAIVMGMLDREARKVRAKVVPNVKRETLQAEILNQIESKSIVYTDGWPGYDTLKAKEFIHETVNHVKECVRGQVHTQGDRQLLEFVEARFDWYIRRR